MPGMELITRRVCQSCGGEGHLLRPQLAIVSGTGMGASVLAPTYCRDCGGEGWTRIITTLPDPQP